MTNMLAVPSGKIKIVLIDDDDVDAMGVERSLNKLKFVDEIVRATDGHEALDLLLHTDVTKHPYIILLDLNMPRMNGFEFLEQLREHPLLSGSVVFVLSTSNDQQDKLKAYKKQIAGFIVKDKFKLGYQPLIDLLTSYYTLIDLPAF